MKTIKDAPPSTSVAIDSKCSVCGAVLVSVSIICLTALLIADAFFFAKSNQIETVCYQPDYHTPEEDSP